MPQFDFSEIASRYESKALLQRSAADVLFDLIGIGPGEDVLDIGCGTGQLTAKIREMTKGRVVGIDPAEGMVREARSRYGGLGIDFQVGTAEQLDCVGAFDVVFSNSSLPVVPRHPTGSRPLAPRAPPRRLGWDAGPRCARQLADKTSVGKYSVLRLGNPGHWLPCVWFHPEQKPRRVKPPDGQVVDSEAGYYRLGKQEFVAPDLEVQPAPGRGHEFPLYGTLSRVRTSLKML